MASIVLAWNCCVSAQTLPLPPRPTNASSATTLIDRLTPLDLASREQEIYAQIIGGNVPHFLRTLCPVQVTNVLAGNTNSATFYVTPDYLAVGSDEDYFLTPISPNLAQRIADALNCSLPTRKMVDAVYATAAVKLAPSPIPPSAAMTTVPIFGRHNTIVRAQRLELVNRQPLGTLTAGHQKDIVLSALLASSPGKVAIYGWHQTNGIPIQPLYLGHTAAWVDYSQCTRLVQQRMSLNGQATTVSAVLTNPAVAPLLSDEGAISSPRYPTNALPKTEPNTSVARTEARPQPFIGFQETNRFNERTASFTFEPDVKIHVNAPVPERFAPGRKVLLIFYTLPNGNTTAQTIGKVLKPGDDWHYDIQQIGAQTRFLRELMPDRTIVVAYLESTMKSWVAWRKTHGDKQIPAIVGSITNLFATNDLEFVLSGHSGGGSFIFGYLNAVESLPDNLVRIAFLDSNYAYDRALGHQTKLVRWLDGSANHYLCVLAYNDANALLDGKPFVSAAGGTWGRSHTMQSDLAESLAFTTRTNADFQRFAALDGRVQLILKENPERKIYHTVQVERNGFIHSMVSGTTLESKGYEYFGDRAYSKLVDENLAR